MLGLHNKTASTRWQSLDIMRALALGFMVQAHFVFYWSPWYPNKIAGAGPSDWLGAWIDLDSLAAPMFLFVSGFCVYLAGQRSEKFLQSPLLYRGLGLLVLGFMMSLMMRGHLMVNDILNVIGVATILLILLWRLPGWAFFMLACLLALIAPALQTWGGYLPGAYDAQVWPGINDAVFSFKEGAINYLLRGNQALIPWLSFSFIGFGLAKYWHYWPHRFFRGVLGFIGLSLTATAFALSFGEWGGMQVFVFSYYPLTTALLSLSLGVTLLLLLGLFYFFDDKGYGLPKGIDFFVTYFSRYALTVYVLHLFLCLGLLRWAGWLMAGDQYYWLETLFTSLTAMFMSWGFLLILNVALWWWDTRYAGKYSLEWWLRQLRAGKH